MKIYKTQADVEKDIKDGELFIDEDVIFECSISIEADIHVIGDIIARDIDACNIIARNITACNITARDIIETEKNPKRAMKEKTFAEQLYELKCGEKMFPGDYSVIYRVPGGWIFSQGEDIESSVFAPWNNEFQPEKDTK